MDNEQKVRERAIETLVAVDPELVIERMLSVAMTHSGAIGAGVFLIDRGVATFVAGRGSVNATSCGRALVGYRDQTVRLSMGRPWFEDCICIWPLEARVRGAILYAEGDRPLSRPGMLHAMDAILVIMQAAIRRVEERRGRGDAIDDFLEATPPTEVARRQIETILKRNDGNVSRAARVMGLSRPTLYRRMQLLKIERAGRRHEGPA